MDTTNIAAFVVQFLFASTMPPIVAIMNGPAASFIDKRDPDNNDLCKIAALEDNANGLLWALDSSARNHTRELP